MSIERKHINDIEIKDIIGRWDAEPNDFIDRIFIRETGNLEVIQKSSGLVAEVSLNQQTDVDLPILEILTLKGDNTHFDEDSWTIWRYSGDEMDIDFSDDLRITFNLIN
ncbi:hypothetical protein [Christiangramia echinicola]|uniref:hypothetical protein n=1 Tax=Christiangramia echinicola TaxID=279359 RepID=UPI0004040152|nr:hypothetical protein [Christiangramia echinicola]